MLQDLVKLMRGKCLLLSLTTSCCGADTRNSDISAQVVATVELNVKYTRKKGGVDRKVLFSVDFVEEKQLSASKRVIKRLALAIGAAFHNKS